MIMGIPQMFAAGSDSEFRQAMERQAAKYPEAKRAEVRKMFRQMRSTCRRQYNGLREQMSAMARARMGLPPLPAGRATHDWTKADNDRRLREAKQDLKRSQAATGDDWASLCHEAAHAVVGLVLGAKIQIVQAVHHKRWHVAIDTEGVNAQSRGVIAYAGAAAECRATGATARPCSAADNAIARRALLATLGRNYSKSRLLDLSRQWKAASATVVGECWSAIQDVAKELNAQQIMNGRQVREIVSRHIDLDE